MTTAFAETASAALPKVRAVWAASSALLLHAGVALAGRYAPRAEPIPAVIVTEIELAPPAAPMPEVAPELPAAPALAAVRAPRPRAAKQAPAPVTPAAAGPLLTTDAPPSPTEAPVRFAVDAQGAGYGFGVVARGGSGQGAGGRAEPSAAAIDASEKSAPATNFAVPPGLAEQDPCRGFFPAGADADSGEVVVSLVVSRGGAVQHAEVVRESPPGQGFGAAALSCLKRKRFSPALDHAGAAITAKAPVALNFRR